MKKIVISLVFISIYACCISQQLKLSYDASVYNQPFTGKVIAYLSKDNRTPLNTMIGLEPLTSFAISVKNIQPGQVVLMDDKAISYPTILSKIERAGYFIQVVWDRNLGGRAIAQSPGNLYNEPQRIDIGYNTKQVFSVIANKKIPEPELFKNTEFAKEIKSPSALLSAFHKKDISLNGAVLLPKSYYTDSLKKFPLLVEVKGYGGNYLELSGRMRPSNPMDSIEVIRLLLDGNCPLGHSVYANSENNGPWGDALITELIPLLEKTYRCNGARLVTGHSSGGWSSLWLQTQYPETFIACWSSAPDPVSFEKFQQINLYTDKNMFFKKDSSLQPVATVAGYFNWGFMKEIYGIEEVIYRGEQMQSFNAVFSKKGKNGMPENICNSITGNIDTTVFQHWKNYDIALNLKNNWDKLKPVLDGKIKITVGRQDNFMLNLAVTVLEKQMKSLNADMAFKYFPGDHFTIATPEYFKEGYGFLRSKYEAWLKNKGL